MRVTCVSLWIVCFFPGLAAAQEMVCDDAIDSPMYQLPALPAPREFTVFPDKAKGLWLRALQRPETDMRYKAAETFALAHRAGMKGLTSAIAPLRAALDRPGEATVVRLALADALIALEAREAAESLFLQAKTGGVELRNLIEPALARWDYRPARALWLERLRDPKTPSRSLVLAIRGLADVHEGGAVEPLRELAFSERSAGTIRVEAARALGVLRTEGLEGGAERLSRDRSRPGLVKRLAAVELLRRHTGARAVVILQGLAVDSEPAVADAALARLLEIDPGRVIPMVERLVANADPKIRMHGIEALLRRPSDSGMRLLGERLADFHREVRARARRSLLELAEKKPEFREPVVAQATRMLATAPWQGLEQAVILLAQLDHKPAAGRLLKLLTFDRPEVRVTAAWGLRKLTVPETYPELVRHSERHWQRLNTGTLAEKRAAAADRFLEHELSQVHQCLGLGRYTAADAVLRRYIPKPDMKSVAVSKEARAAAIWALGLIHAGKPNTELGPSLEQRLKDVGGPGAPPEDGRVRLMSAISLGRMKATAQLASLRRFCPGQQAGDNRICNACGWAVEQITGDPLKPPVPVPVPTRWFLMPAE
jgi:HEAT repeat protein